MRDNSINMKEQDNEKIKRIDALIDRFIHSEMSEEEEAEFMAEVKADAELSEYARTSMLLIKGVQKVAEEDDAEMLRMLKDATLRDAYSASGKKYPSYRTARFWQSTAAIGAAACLCLFFTSRYITELRINETILNVELPTTLYERGTEEALDFTVIAENINDKKFLTSTIVQLENMYQESLTPSAADTQTQAVVGWYLIKAYIAVGKKDECIPILEQLIKNNDRDTDAKTLLKKIKK